ncbi:RecX family transcriptional regulator [Sphingosinicella sp.]|uniref:RecX family transcriptional regulator n=1 Tax=Sphingosinicella sp. TaxID=1917971 RepID=UPI0040375FC0
MAMGRGERRKAPPLEEGSLERLALRYAERYATSRAKLARYLLRKTRERGWDGAADAPPIEAIVARMAGLGYVDDRAFAAARAATLTRRGLGARRIAADLHAAGIGADDSVAPRAAAEAEALAAALHYARKRKIGPFAPAAPDRAGREKALAALLRAGHPLDLARKIAAAAPGEEIDPVDT